jgi:hypothetical protein
LTAIKKTGVAPFGLMQVLFYILDGLELATRNTSVEALGAHQPCYLAFGESTRKSIDRTAWDVAVTGEEKQQVRLAHCIFGNPFRPVAFSPAWRSETAVALATGIYAERAFDRLPILADALEEAGCDHADILAHCRDPKAIHARGCWVVDLVLGKS